MGYGYCLETKNSVTGSKSALVCTGYAQGAGLLLNPAVYSLTEFTPVLVCPVLVCLYMYCKTLSEVTSISRLDFH